MTLVSLVLTAWLGSMFLYSAGLKFAWYDRAGNLIKPYLILPSRIDSMVGFLLPWLELLAGLLLLLGLLFPLGPLLGATLGGSFAYAAIWVLHRGADVPCGCTGGVKDRVNRTTLIRAVTITVSSFLLLPIEPILLPSLILVPVILVSLAPSAISIYRRIRAAQWQQPQNRNLQEEIVQARHILMNPPSNSMLDS